MRVLVTGGAGFIGSNFVHRSLARDIEITVLDKMTYAANPENLKGTGVRLVEGDICSSELVEDLVAQNDLVVHFAAESHNDNSLRDPLAFVRTNIEGTVNLIKSCARHGVRFHHISTDEVYGDLSFTDPSRFTPDTPYNPSSPYSASKAASDHMVRAWVRSYGLQATLSNCSNNYGPRQHPEKFIPRQILNLLHGRPARLYGSGNNIRDWIHVDDHNDAVWTIIERGEIGKTYLIGADGERSNKDVVYQLQTLIGGDVVHVTDRPGHDRRYAIDPASTRALGWRPQRTFEEGLAETVEWYRAHPQWWRESFVAAEKTYAQHEEILH